MKIRLALSDRTWDVETFFPSHKGDTFRSGEVVYQVDSIDDGVVWCRSMSALMEEESAEGAIAECIVTLHEACEGAETVQEAFRLQKIIRSLRA